MKSLPKPFKDILDAIEQSIQKDRIIPVLILVYSGIDNISNLAAMEEQPAGIIFKEWVKKWMMEKYSLPCTETDIWSARCGLLHQQISESKLTKGGKAREIYYSHGGADPKALQLVINLANKDAICVVLEDLIGSFKKGMVDCINEIEKNENWKRSFDFKAKKLFVTMKSDQ